MKRKKIKRQGRLSKKNLTDAVSNYIRKEKKVEGEIQIKGRNDTPMETRSINHNLFRVSVDYENSNGNLNSLSIIVKRDKKRYVDYSKMFELRKDTLLQEAKILKLLHENECAVPSIIHPRESLVVGYRVDKRILLMEDVGNQSLESKLVENRVESNDSIHNKISLVKKTIEAISKIHVVGKNNLSRLNLSKEDYALKLINYLDGISRYKNITLSEEDRIDIRKYVSEMIKDLEEGSKDFIHADLHWGHVYSENGGIKIIDFASAMKGPSLFDIVDLLKHPMIRLRQDKIEELIKVYRNAKKHYMDNLKPKSMEYQQEEKFNKIRFFSEIYRDFRAAAKSCWLELNHPDSYEDYTKINPKYPEYKKYYLEDAKKLLERDPKTHHFTLGNSDNLKRLADRLTNKEIL